MREMRGVGRRAIERGVCVREGGGGGDGYEEGVDKEQTKRYRSRSIDRKVGEMRRGGT